MGKTSITMVQPAQRHQSQWYCQLKVILEVGSGQLVRSIDHLISLWELFVKTQTVHWLKFLHGAQRSFASFFGRWDHSSWTRELRLLPQAVILICQRFAVALREPKEFGLHDYGQNDNHYYFDQY